MVRRLTNASKITMDGNELCINTKQGDYYCYREILDRSYEQLSAMLSYHSKILVVRLDFHLDEYSQDNSLISKIIKKLRKHLCDKYGMKRFGYIWVREQERSKSQHYHLALILNGNKIRVPTKLIHWIEDRWCHYGTCYTPQNCYSMIKRGDDVKFKESFERISYLAKTRGKGYLALGSNNYSASRIGLKV